MNYYVYLIGSRNKTKLRTYVGFTNNLRKRLFFHNTGKGAKSTRGRKWELFYYKKYKNKKKAMSEEYILKKDRMKRKFITTKFLSTN